MILALLHSANRLLSWWPHFLNKTTAKKSATPTRTAYPYQTAHSEPRWISGWSLGSLGMIHDPFPTIDKRIPWAAIPATLDAILMGQFATGRIDPLLVAETAEEMLCYLDLAEPRFTGDERQDVVCKRHARKRTRSGFSCARRSLARAAFRAAGRRDGNSD